MKATSTLVIVLLLANILKAQPGLNSQNLPAYGTIVSAQSKTDNTLNPGSAGASQVWDFSTVTFPGASSSSQLVNPSATTYGSSFPTANFAENTAAGNNMYYDLTSTHQIILGMRENTQGVTVIYADPMNLINYPFAYNTTQNRYLFCCLYR